MSRHVQSGQVVTGGLVNELRRVIEEDSSCFYVVALSGHVQAREAVLGLGVDRGAAVEQKLDDLIVARAGGTVEGSKAVAGLDIDLCACV